MISMLIIQSVWDCMYRQIPIWVTVAGGSIGVCVSIMNGRPWIEVGMGLLPGVICLLIGWITREAIGYGDGFLLCAMGMYLSLEAIVMIIMLASIFAGIVGLILIILRRVKKRDLLPFVPFLLVATIIQLILEGGIII